MPFRYNRWWFIALALLVYAGCNSRPPSGSDSISPMANADSAKPPHTSEPTQVGSQGEMVKVQFVSGYAAGYQRARSEQKPMLVFFTAKWCRFCHEMQREAFANDQVVRLSQEFVCVLVDADEETGTCSDFGIRGYPTIQFISPDGVQLNRLVGRAGAIELAGQMRAALRATSERMAAAAKDTSYK
jgi:thiol:disulfide interchange protein